MNSCVKWILARMTMVIILVAMVTVALVKPLEAQVTGSSAAFFPRFLEADEVVVLSSVVSGIIKDIKYHRQDFVKKGETLVQLDDDLIKLDIAKFEAQIAMAKAVDIEKAKIALQYAEDNLKIIQQLHNRKIGGTRVGSEKELKEAMQQRDMARLELEKAKKNVALLQIELQKDNKVLSQHKVVSPIDGVIVSFSSVKSLDQQNLKRPEVGELIQTARPLVALMKVDVLRVSKTLPKSMLSKVHLGQKALVYVESSPNQALPGRVVYISPTIIPALGEFNIEVEFKNPLVAGKKKIISNATYPYRFRPGMRARVELEK